MNTRLEEHSQKVLYELDTAITDAKDIFTNTENGRCTAEAHEVIGKLIPKVANLYKRIEHLFLKLKEHDVAEINAFTSDMILRKFEFDKCYPWAMCMQEDDDDAQLRRNASPSKRVMN